MNTAYNNTTTVQESRNRYNQLLQAALKRINDRKSNKDAEEVTTTEATATTPTQQPEPVATPENVTTEPNEASEPEQVTATAPTKTRRTKTTSPKPLGRDIYHIFYEKQSRWAIMFDKSVYHDPEGYAVLSDNVILIESKLDYKEEHSGKLIQEDGTESKKDPQLLSKYKEICRPTGDKYATTPKEIEERIKAVQDEEKRTALCDLFDKDMTPEEVKEELKYNKEARAHANAKANPKFVKLLFPTGDYTFLHLKQLKRGLSVAKKLGTNCISKPNNILQFAGEAGRIIVAGCIISPEDESAIAHLTIDLTDATPAPEDTAIEATATAPQATEEDTTPAPEEVATETPVNEPEEVTTEEVATTAPEVVTTAEDDATLLRNLIDQYGNVGADYLDTLDYSKATEQETTPAPEATKQEEPIHAPQMLKKMIEEHKKRIKDGTATESIYNADALQTEVLTPKRAKELLGGCFSNYKTYILVDGTHIVETDRPTLKNTLYIDDESPEYKEYQRGNISAVELYRDDMISMYGSKGKIKAVEDNPATLTVDSARYKVLSFNLYRRADYVYRRANPDEVEIYKAAMRASHEAFTKRLDSYIRRYGKKIYVHSYWANR